MVSGTFATSYEDLKFLIETFDNLGTCFHHLYNTTGSSNTTVVQTRLHDYCEIPNSEVSVCVGFNDGSISLDFQVYGLQNWYYWYFSDMCNEASNTVNTDIAGPVTTSETRYDYAPQYGNHDLPRHFESMYNVVFKKNLVNYFHGTLFFFRSACHLSNGHPNYQEVQLNLQCDHFARAKSQ
ncbi:hypothetical protein N7462_007763 [Penicillium macrosclerotiorum]|uniref:uncharacterized protein n=1 Tax=Penicillium macrosclerotiorum TaxID=303699 RepID=UPI0025496992|nr:uncharacterized protein N7462_007763 [Penicillium macrosclerotiorum]KAJ5679519.1 hypothetical protein N7462_007763 [Penicillium macrosclerotiorum]